MESSNLWYFVLFLIPFMYVCVDKLIIRKKKDVENVRLPPGTSGLPFFGETLSFYLKYRKGILSEFISDRMRRYSSKIFRTSLMGENVAVMSTAEGNKFLFTNEGKLVESWFPRHLDQLFHKSGDQTAHAQGKMLRNVLHPRFLKVGGLQDCASGLDTVMKRHLEAYWTCGKDDHDQVIIIKAAEMAKKYAVAAMGNLLLGVNDLSEIEQYVEELKIIEAGIVSAPINLPGTAWIRGFKAAKVLTSRLEALVRGNKIGKTPLDKNFFADMISAKDENGESMPLQDIAANLAGLLLASFSTTQTTMTMLIKALADHPHVYDSILQEHREIASSKSPGDGLQWEDFQKMKHSWNAVREILRIYISGVGFFKEALTDITYEGYTIPKGWKIYWLAQSTQMDSKYFPNPEKFDPSRWEREVPVPFTFIPFAAGSGICPGHIFAKLETLTFLHYVVTKFRWETVNPNEKILFDFHPYPAEGLPIRLYRH